MAWETHKYWWPDTISYWHRNRLYLSIGNKDLRWINSRDALVETYRNVNTFDNLPMIYNGFVHRDLINAVIDRYGVYFVTQHHSPDVISGLVNLAFTKEYLYSFRPLSIRGMSKRSCGTAAWERSLGKEQIATFLSEQRATIEELSHPNITASPNVHFGIAGVKSHVKDLLFPHDNELRLDLKDLVRYLIANLNNDVDAYDENLADTLRLAEKIGFKVDPNTIPAKSPEVTAQFRTPWQGLYGSGAKLSMGINCDVAGVSNVAGAARLADSMSNPVTIRVAHPVELGAERKAS
jgi:hypothetical protein